MSLDIYLEDPIESEDELFWKNITHNLGKMAKEAGFYNQLWHAEGIKTASDLIPYIEKGMIELATHPRKYKQFSADNGWGTYEQFIPWLGELLEGLRDNPEGLVRTST